MKNVLRLLLPLVLMLGFAGVAVAQEDCPGGSCDPFVQSPDPDATLTANAFHCSVKGSNGGLCVDCVQSRTQTNQMWCQTVGQSAKCQCDTVKCPAGQANSTSGSCTYYP